MNTYLHLSTENQGKIDKYAEGLLQAQESHDNVIPLFAVEVLSDVSLSAGLGGNHSLMNTRQRPSMLRKNSMVMISLLGLKEILWNPSILMVK